MDKEKIKNELIIFASEVMRDVCVQTHTDWTKYLEPVVEKAAERLMKKLKT